MRINDLSLFTTASDIGLPSLTTLHLAYTGAPKYTLAVIIGFLFKNWKTLRNLRLGFGSKYMDDMCNANSPKLTSALGLDRLFFTLRNIRCEAVRRGELASGQPLLRLDNLHIYEFDFTGNAILDVQPNIDLIDLSCLKSLFLDQCEGVFDIFGRNGVNAANFFGWTPNLKAFSLKAKSWSDNEHRALEAFFASFTGLEHIAVLIQDKGSAYWPGNFVANHCRTLKSLVWEHNFAPRTRKSRLRTQLKRREYHFLAYVCEVCPNLRELGIALPIPTHHWRYKVLSIISTQLRRTY